MRSHIEEAIRDMTFLVRPDAHVLVEGPSDEIYLTRCFDLIDSRDVFVKVEKQEGASSMERRVRDLKKDGVVSIITIVDADAPKVHEDLKRLLAGAPHAQAWILPRGAIEDQFSPELHATALNTACPHGDAVLPSDLSADGDVVASLKRVVWEKKRVSYDKVAHAKAVAALLNTTEDIPAELRSIIDSAVAHAARSRRESPRTASYLSLDRRTLDALKAWRQAGANTHTET